MTRDLTQLTTHVDQMRTKLADTADAERALVQRLNDELKSFDQQTLQGVRTIAAEHEARRAGILDELHALAASIGTFAPAREPPQPLSQRNGAARAFASGTYHDELERSLRALVDERSAMKV